VTTPDRALDLWRAGQRGFPPAYPLVQLPNAPLLLALVASLASRALDGQAYGSARAVFFLGLSAWAWLEITAGSNTFRRALGVAGAVYVVVALGGDLAS
jgi:hypothetical protein